MARVRISYDPDLSKIGTVQEVPADEARQLVRRGRATYVKDAAAPVAESVVAPPAAPHIEEETSPDVEPDTEHDETEAGTSLDLDED